MLSGAARTGVEEEAASKAGEVGLEDRDGSAEAVGLAVCARPLVGLCEAPGVTGAVSQVEAALAIVPIKKVITKTQEKVERRRPHRLGAVTKEAGVTTGVLRRDSTGCLLGATLRTRRSSVRLSATVAIVIDTSAIGCLSIFTRLATSEGLGRLINHSMSPISN